MNESCWHCKTFLSFSFMKGRSFFDVVGNFGLKKMTPNCNALAKSIISYLWVSYYTFVFSWQCKIMLFTTKHMQWRHRSVRIALRGIDKKRVEIGECQNRCHDGMHKLKWSFIVLHRAFRYVDYVLKVCMSDVVQVSRRRRDSTL